MKKAIDNYAVGRQKEVTAWAGESISADIGRFCCPECLEYVALDKRGHFRHKNKTPQSIECEKRVDSPSQSTYEKLGLPLFVKEFLPGLFNLYLGFYPLPDTLIEEAMRSNAGFCVCGESSAQYKISNSRFDSIHHEYIRMMDLPTLSGKYRITYSPGTPKAIIQRWTENSDIWGAGQFFKVGAEYSRKVRPLGSIVAEEKYYFVGRQWTFDAYKRIVDMREIGQLCFNSTKRPIYCIVVHNLSGEGGLLEALSRMLQAKFHVSLLVREATLLPLWPPCHLDDNYLIYPESTQKATLLVSSPNDQPTIFRHLGCIPIEDSAESGIPPLYQLQLSNCEIPISVDRTYSGNTQFFRRQSIKFKHNTASFDIRDTTNTSIIDDIPKSIKKTVFTVYASCPCNVFHIRSNGTETMSIIDSGDGVVIKDVRWNDVILVYSQSGLFLGTYRFRRPKFNCDSAESALISKIRAAHGPMIRIDQRMIALCRQYSGIPELQKYIRKYVQTGVMPKSVYNILRNGLGGT